MTHEDWEFICWMMVASVSLTFIWEAFTAKDDKTKDKED